MTWWEGQSAAKSTPNVHGPVTIQGCLSGTPAVLDQAGSINVDSVVQPCAHDWHVPHARVRARGHPNGFEIERASWEYPSPEDSFWRGKYYSDMTSCTLKVPSHTVRLKPSLLLLNLSFLREKKKGGFGQVCMDTGESLAANQYRLESMVGGKVVLLLPR